jgi:hypothetical protein
MRLYVSVNNFLNLVKVLQPFEELNGDHSEDLLRDSAALGDNGGKTSRIHVLQRNRNTLLGQKRPIRPDNIGVVALLQHRQFRDNCVTCT